MDRNLEWDGLVNARDLGGLPTTDGRRTRPGAVVRAAALDHLTGEGWAALREHGIRTIVDLRNDDERTETRPPDDLVTVRVPLNELVTDELRADHGDVGGTPLWVHHYLEDPQGPRAAAALVSAVAHAEPGGVVVHCAIGRDRTGIAMLVLLATAGVLPEEIAADYVLSTERLRPVFAGTDGEEWEAVVATMLEAHGTTATQCVLDAVAGLDVERYLREGGLDNRDISALRQRMLD
jgi:protein-tyrosine phosphatase